MEERRERRYIKQVEDYANKFYGESTAFTRVFNISASKYCRFDVDTILYSWDYDSFVELETHILCHEDIEHYHAVMTEASNKRTQEAQQHRG